MRSEEDHRYNEIDFFDITQEIKMLQEAFCGFIKYLDYPADLKVGVSLRLLIDVIVRVDKRKVYYIYYHDMKINECKQVALYAYWLLRFRPFFIYDRRLESNRLGYCINELFAIFLIFAVLRKLYDINNIPFDSTDKNSYCYKLLYNFRFRHISIDEMILLIDSITKDTLLRKYEVD